MGQELNVQINQFNGTSYDILYPETNVKMVQGLSATVVCSITPALEGVTLTLSNATQTYSAISDINGTAIINVDVFGTYNVSFDNPDIKSATTSIDLTFYGVYDIVAVYAPYVTYTVIIDETNSNPETALTYADDAVGMVKVSSVWDNKDIFNSIKPCVLQNGIVNYYLNPNDYTKKMDGTASDLTGASGDVMVEFSKFAYRIYRDGTNLYVSVTNNPNAKLEDNRWSFGAFSRDSEGDRSKMYVGAYHGCTIANKLRSVSGKVPTVNQTIGTFRTQAQANGTGYQQFAFYQLTALQCLYIVKYGNLNSQSALGMGYVSGSAAKASGDTNANGMYYGTTSSTQSVKFAGLEDFWGNVYDWIDGLYSNNSWHILTNYGSYNDTGTGYTDNGQGATSDIFGYISQTQGINSNTGFVIKTGGGSNSTYFADSGYLDNACLPYVGGSWNAADSAGPFRLNVNFYRSEASAHIGARLSYC